MKLDLIFPFTLKPIALNPFIFTKKTDDTQMANQLRTTKRVYDLKKAESPEFTITESEIFKLKSRGYKMMRKLGQGVSSKIFLCTSLKDNSEEVKMACKVIDKKKGEKHFITKFLPREIKILTDISNPHCIQVYSILEMSSKTFVFMRYAEKGDLLDYLSEEGAVEDEGLARMWMRQLLLALKYLHSKQITHRDIKCENVLITINLNAKLADFGFSRYWTDAKGLEVLSETFCGSISYAAPEILSGTPYSPKYCDVWSLGVVFFVMFNLSKPFTMNKTGPLLKQQLGKEYRWRPRAEAIVNRGAKDIVTKMLEPDCKVRGVPIELLQMSWMMKDKMLLHLVPDDCSEEAAKELSLNNFDRGINSSAGPSF